jgi:cell division protein FtsA
MRGVRLEPRCHLVTAASHAVENIIKCAERVNLHVAEVVLEPLASAAAVLSPDEREIGVALIDVGGGTTDVIIYVDGAVVHTSVIPIGATPGVGNSYSLMTGFPTDAAAGTVAGTATTAMARAITRPPVALRRVRMVAPVSHVTVRPVVRSPTKQR